MEIFAFILLAAVFVFVVCLLAFVAIIVVASLALIPVELLFDSLESLMTILKGFIGGC